MGRIVFFHDHPSMIQLADGYNPASSYKFLCMNTRKSSPSFLHNNSSSVSELILLFTLSNWNVSEKNGDITKIDLYTHDGGGVWVATP